MGRLLPFELQKVWCSRSFVLLTCALLAVNTFFLWYTSLGGEGEPQLSAYKSFQAYTAGMSEAEKKACVEEYKQTMDGIAHVCNILALQNNEMGSFFAVEERRTHPGLYESGEYLRYTDSPEREEAFANELYREVQKVAGYEDFLKSVQESRNVLAGISIFAVQEEEDFSFRNIEKSAADYEGLTSEGVRWTPAKPVVSALESPLTDILLILSTVLFTGSLILEEKQKGLILITHSTRYGLDHSILARLLALLIHCLSMPVVFYGVNCLYFGLRAGWCDMTARLQSLAPCLESSLPVTIGEYLLLSVLTKGLVLFGAAAMLTAVCIFSGNMVVPYFTEAAFWTASWALYEWIPGASGWSPLKAFNLYGALRTEKLYGAYCNLNLWGHPFSRAVLSWLGVGAAVLGGMVLSFAAFRQGRRLQIFRERKRLSFRFRPYTCLFRYETYKILIAGHGLVILLAFGVLTGYYELTRTYNPSVQEQYYQDLMLQLEGEQTDDKRLLIVAEEARYREAFAELERIEEAVDSGMLDQETGRSMKTKWQGITAFYSAFQRAEQQHRFADEHGESCIYDTGYLYLLGVRGEDGLNVFLLVTLGIILAFSHVISVEYQTGAGAIIYATARGKGSITAHKVGVCLLAAVIFLILPFVCRMFSVSAAFPIRGLFLEARSIPFYRGWLPGIPAVVLLLAKLFVQMLSGVFLTLVVLVFSARCRNHIRALFVSFLVLCVPVMLTVLGFDFMRWFSLYPLYSWYLG